MTNEKIYKELIYFASERLGGFNMDAFFVSQKKYPKKELSDLLGQMSTTNTVATDRPLYVEFALKCNTDDNQLHNDGLQNLCACHKYKITARGLEIYSELKELEEAQKNAKEAKRYSLFAIMISLLALVVSIYTGYKQINIASEQNKEGIKIEDTQFKQILNTVKE